ncbi:MAG: carbohydrate ABC transporter permease [Oscillospiraceae bacterium]|nr:carbohydrate ABC transporter permease [Oscillospiraceae bacterium]
MNNQTVVKRESKNKIKVEFERTPLLKRLKAKYLTVFFLTKVIWVIFRLVLLVGISYVVLFPFFAKITGSFMSPQDFIDTTVKMVPKSPTLQTYRAIIVENNYWKALLNTAVLSLLCAVAQMFICTMVGYGFSKFKFKGNTIAFGLVIFTLLVPHPTLQFSMFMEFRYFDFLNIFEGIRRLMGFTKATDLKVNMINTYWPLALLSLTGLAFKNGLYILIMRQAFKGFPDEYEEAAYVDGSGVFKTFFQIVMPNMIPMMVTIFLFAFTWQWTDEFYVNLFTTENGPYLLPKIVQIPRSLTLSQAAIQASTMYQSAIRNTCGLMIIAPLIVVYLIGQRFLIQGIERTGMTAD